jgi:trk system potassium uptake protein TrkA
MRIVFVGAGEMSVKTARLLVDRGHEVVIIDEKESVLEELSEQLDCSFLHGDGSKPQILEEAGPDITDILFCLTDSDQDNILAALVGRSLGFEKVIISIVDEAFETVCLELGLENTIVPSRTISRYLADMTEGRTIFELSAMIKHDARLFTFIAGENEAGPVSDLDLPSESRVICLYRDETFRLIEDDESVRENDEIIILTHAKNLPDLKQRWNPVQANNNND